MSTLKVKYNDEWQNVGATGTALTALAENVGILNSKVDSIKVSNPNLLDNPWFTVNQRGVTAGASIGGGSDLYGYDRWRARNSSYPYTVMAGGGVRGSIRQYLDIPYEKVNGKTYTLSILREDGEIISVSGLAETASKPTTSTTYFSKNGDDYNLELWCSASSTTYLLAVDIYSTKTVFAVKLELGNKSTLAYDSAPNYATELLKCQRYYYRFHGIVTGVWITNGWLRFPVPVPVRMRSTTRVVTYSYAQFHYGGSWHDYGSTTGMTLSEIQFEDYVLINVTGVSSTAYNASIADLGIGISADL